MAVSSGLLLGSVQAWVKLSGLRVRLGGVLGPGNSHACLLRVSLTYRHWVGTWVCPCVDPEQFLWKELSKLVFEGCGWESMLWCWVIVYRVHVYLVF